MRKDYNVGFLVIALVILLAGCKEPKRICTDDMAYVHSKLPQVYKHCKESK